MLKAFGLVKKNPLNRNFATFGQRFRPENPQDNWNMAAKIALEKELQVLDLGNLGLTEEQKLAKRLQHITLNEYIPSLEYKTVFSGFNEIPAIEKPEAINVEVKIAKFSQKEGLMYFSKTITDPNNHKVLANGYFVVQKQIGHKPEALTDKEVLVIKNNIDKRYSPKTNAQKKPNLTRPIAVCGIEIPFTEDEHIIHENQVGSNNMMSHQQMLDLLTQHVQHQLNIDNTGQKPHLVGTQLAMYGSLEAGQSFRLFLYVKESNTKKTVNDKGELNGVATITDPQGKIIAILRSQYKVQDKNQSFLSHVQKFALSHDAGYKKFFIKNELLQSTKMSLRIKGDTATVTFIPNKQGNVILGDAEYKDLNTAKRIALERGAKFFKIKSGSEKNFVLGTHVGAWSAAIHPIEIKHGAVGQAQQFLNSMLKEDTMQFIVIANGKVKNTGFGLFTAAHYGLCTPDARFVHDEILHGAIPAPGEIINLTNKVGSVAAAYIVLGGQKYNAEQAKELGLVDEIVVNHEDIKSFKENVKQGYKRSVSEYAISGSLDSHLKHIKNKHESGVKQLLEIFDRLQQEGKITLEHKINLKSWLAGVTDAFHAGVRRFEYGEGKSEESRAELEQHQFARVTLSPEAQRAVDISTERKKEFPVENAVIKEHKHLIMFALPLPSMELSNTQEEKSKLKFRE